MSEVWEDEDELSGDENINLSKDVLTLKTF